MADREASPPLIPQIEASGVDELRGPQPEGLRRLEGQQGLVQGAKRVPHQLIPSRNPGDIVLRLLSIASGWLILAIAAGMILVLVIQSRDAIVHFGLGFFSSSAWDPASNSFGAFPEIAGTLYSSLLALLLAGPIGILIAIFLSEMAPRPLRLPFGFLVELLAAVPSIVYGLWALFVLVPLIAHYVTPFFSQHFGGFFLFSNASVSGLSLLTASLILSVMILPTIAAISRDVIMAVPSAQREAMLALGATRWETTWKVIVPYARSGIIGAVVLALGRAVGETMAVQMVIGNASSTGWSVLSLATTMPARIVNQFSEATPGLYQGAILELALVLLVITIVLNAIARVLVWSVTRKYAT